MLDVSRLSNHTGIIYSLRQRKLRSLSNASQSNIIQLLCLFWVIWTMLVGLFAISSGPALAFSRSIGSWSCVGLVNTFRYMYIICEMKFNCPAYFTMIFTCINTRRPLSHSLRPCARLWVLTPEPVLLPSKVAPTGAFSWVALKPYCDKYPKSLQSSIAMLFWMALGLRLRGYNWWWSRDCNPRLIILTIILTITLTIAWMIDSYV